MEMAGNLAYHLGATAWMPEQGYQVLMLGLSWLRPVRGRARFACDLSGHRRRFRVVAATTRKPGISHWIVLGKAWAGRWVWHYPSRHSEQRARIKAMVLDGVPASYREVGQFALSTLWLTWPLQVPLSWLVPDADSAVYAMRRKWRYRC